MRTLPVLFLSLILSVTSFAKQPADGYFKFYNQQRKASNTVSFKIPASFASIFFDKHEDKEIKDFLKELDDLSFLIIDKVTDAVILDLNESMPEELYKQLMIVRDGDTEISFMVRDNGEFVQELIMTVVEPEELVILCFTGEISRENAKKLAKSINVNSASSFRQ